MKKIILAAILSTTLFGCLGLNKDLGNGDNSTSAVLTGGPGGGGAGGSITPPSTTSSSVANSDNIVARVTNALTLPGAGKTSLVSPFAGNLKNAIAQQSSNFSATSNPMTASGSGATPLVAYAACADVKPASYGVTATSTLATQTNAIIAAGVTIVNQCTANLAAAGTDLNTQVTQVFTTLVQQDAAATGTTTTQAFVSTCTAAASFCVSMLSF